MLHVWVNTKVSERIWSYISVIKIIGIIYRFNITSNFQTNLQTNFQINNGFIISIFVQQIFKGENNIIVQEDIDFIIYQVGNIASLTVSI